MRNLVLECDQTEKIQLENVKRENFADKGFNWDIDIADVVTAAEILQRDVEKYYEMKEHWQYKVH